MEYTYKPTIHAIQYTGSIDEVIEFIGRESISHLAADIYDDPSIGDLVINLYAITTIILAYEKYLVKETFDNGKIEYKTMSEDEFNRYYRHYDVEKVNPPKSLEQAMCEFTQTCHEFEQAVCDTTGSVTDTTPCEDKPEWSGRVARGRKYWYIDISGDVNWRHESEYDIDNILYESDNYFRTEQEALQVRDECQLQLKYHQWRKQHDPAVLDKCGVDKKWSIYPNGDGTVDILFTRNRASVFDKILSSESLAERFYTEHKDLIHRVMGVE